MQEQVQNRLATGKKVNSALDNPNSFFTAAALNDRAQDLSNLLETTWGRRCRREGADEGIKAITKHAEAAKAKANQALASASATDRGTFASEYNKLLSQIEDIAEDPATRARTSSRATTSRSSSTSAPPPPRTS